MSRRPLLRAWLFAALLLLLQQAALAHRIAHLGELGERRSDEPASAVHVCVDCLAFAGIDSGAAPTTAFSIADNAAPAAPRHAVPPAPTLRSAAAYRSRAPPAPLAPWAAAPRIARFATAPY